MTLTDELDQTRRTRLAIEALIAEPAKLGPDFAPIRRLADDLLVGWKATGRGVAGTDLADTLALLAGAASLGLVERLDWAFRCLAFDRAVDAGVDVPLHITPEPDTFVSACPPRLAVSFGRRRDPRRLVRRRRAAALGAGRVPRVGLVGRAGRPG